MDGAGKKRGGDCSFGKFSLLCNDVISRHSHNGLGGRQIAEVEIGGRFPLVAILVPSLKRYAPEGSSAFALVEEHGCGTGTDAKRLFGFAHQNPSGVAPLRPKAIDSERMWMMKPPKRIEQFASPKAFKRFF